MTAGEPRLPGAASLSKSLVMLGSMLPRRNTDNTGQDASDDEDAAFAQKLPLARSSSMSKVCFFRAHKSLCLGQPDAPH